MGSENLIIWNVHGLNSCAYRDTMRELVAAEPPSIHCLQETKLNVILNFDVIQMFGAGFDYTYLPLVQMRGGILVA
jgi:exonuclease III